MSRFLPFVLLLLVLLFPARNVAANDVAVQVKKGVLVVKGDDDANVIALDQAGLGQGSIRITPGVGTTVDGSGAPQVFDGIVNGAKVALGKGSDLMRVTGALQGTAKIDLGTGDNGLNLCDVVFGGDVAIKIGKPTGGPVSVDCGGPGASSSVDASVLFIRNATIDGALTVKAPTSVHVGVVEDAAIGGAVSMKNVGIVGLCYSTVTGGVSVKLPKIVGQNGGSVVCQGGGPESAANGNTAFTMAGTNIGGALGVKAAAGGDGLSFVSVGVQDAATVAFGGGLNFLFLRDVTIGTDLTVKAGKDRDQLDGDGILVGDNATVKYGAGDNDVALGTSTIGENLTVNTGGGNDTITTDKVTVGGTKTIKSGKGADTVS